MKKISLILAFTLLITVVFGQSPTVTDVSPSVAIGETNVVLSGTNFTGATSVVLRSGVDVSLQFRVMNPTTILVKVNLPPSKYVNGRNGSIFIVTNGSGSNTTSPNFTYTTVATACSSVTYGEWGPCKNDKQTRSFVLSPSTCVYKPPKDSLERSCVSPHISGMQYSKTLDVVSFRANINGVLNILTSTGYVVESYPYTAGNVNIDVSDLEQGAYTAETYGFKTAVSRKLDLIIVPTHYEDTAIVITGIFGQSPYTYSLNSTIYYVSNPVFKVSPNTSYTVRVKDAANKVVGLVIKTGADTKKIQTELIPIVRNTGAIADDSAAVEAVPLAMSDLYLEQTIAAASGTLVQRSPTRDRTAPTLNHTYPTMSSPPIVGTVTVQGSATDNVAVTKIVISLDGSVVATLPFNSPSIVYGYNLNTTLYANGIHTLSVAAYDAVNNTQGFNYQLSFSNGITSSGGNGGDITPPSVGFQAPTNGYAWVSGQTATINAYGYDNVGVRSIRFYIDSVLVSTNSSLTKNCALVNPNPSNCSYYGAYSWNTTGYTAGTHTLGIQSIDSAGNVSSTVQIVNTINTTIPTPGLYPVSFKIKIPPVIDQSGEGSCCAMTATYYCGSAHMYKQLNSTTYSYYTNILSPEYVYDRTTRHNIGDNCLYGSNPLLNWQFMYDTGNVLFSNLPYNALNGCDPSVSTPYDNIASSRKTPLYFRCISSDINSVKSAIYGGRAGTTIFALDNLVANAGPGFVWDSHPSSTSPHCMTVIGWDDRIGTNGAFLLVNSWGTNWANNGFAYCTYENFVNVCSYYLYFLND